ncbi:MAG: hypothetical protein ACLFP8_04295 [Alphaproteobacteria bacterium]
MFIALQRGNVLFIVLVAIVLIGALLYAAMPSMRHSLKEAGEGTSISSGAMMQYTASLRAAVAGLLYKGAMVSELEFNRPGHFESCSRVEFCVFHPEGGGISYTPVGRDAMSSSDLTNDWGFSALFEVEGVGVSIEGDFAGNDVLALVYGVSETVCKQMNQDLGVFDVPVSEIEDTVFTGVLAQGLDPSIAGSGGMESGWEAMDGEEVIGRGETAVLAGQAQGCFKSKAGHNVYYSVLLER